MVDFNPSVGGAGKASGPKDVNTPQNVAANELPVKPPSVDKVTLSETPSTEAATPEQVVRAVGAEVATFTGLSPAAQKLLFEKASKA